MKRTILAFLILVTPCLADDAESREMRELIHNLPAREQLVDDVALFRKPAPPNEQQRTAGDRLKKAQEGFQRLKIALRAGTSVFEYPGLIALARPRHSDFDNRYSIVLGIPPGWNWDQPQGTNPDEYRISFDGHGVITAVDPVIYKQ
jgi:hypothetical protein